ncbi:MAG: hypothetical protein IJG84_18540 [Kiritimatiellae bacterium]|nr:hypothetical protein [Kiritimatiellia bacterium]
MKNRNTNRVERNNDKNLPALQRNKIKRDLAQSFVNARCANMAVMEGKAEWSYFIQQGERTAKVIEESMASGDNELINIARWAKDGLMSMACLAKATKVLIPIWMETMPKELRENLESTVVATR